VLKENLLEKRKSGCLEIAANEKHLPRLANAPFKYLGGEGGQLRSKKKRGLRTAKKFVDIERPEWGYGTVANQSKKKHVDTDGG